MAEYPQDLSILYAHNLGSPGLDPRPLSRLQITCSPRVADVIVEGRAISLNAPLGSYDIAEVASRLPAGQKPQMLVAYIDSTLRCLPRSTRSLNVPRTVFIADVHHGARPLKNLIEYLTAEQFDYHFIIATRQSARWFRGAGLRNVFFCGPTVLARPFEGPFGQRREPVIGFVGQVGDFHPRRKRLIEAMLRDGLPLRGGMMPQPQVTSFLAKSLIGFNCSLNGDTSMRIFEVLSAGAMLLTDRLCPESGLDRSLTEGRHFIAYERETDLLEKLRYYLSHPDEAAEIAAAGFQEFQARLRPEEKIRQILEAVLEHKIDPSLRVSDARPIVLGGDFAARVHCYEELQELHRKLEAPQVLYTAGAAKYAEDTEDLIRLHVTVEGRASAGRDPAADWDAVVATEGEVEDRRLPDGYRIVLPA